MFGKFVRHVRQQYAGFLALFVALGGVSYAAVTLPANSVSSKQIKPGAVKTSDLGTSAVTTGKVKDGSLLSRDFKPGQLVAGAPGTTGAPGAIGPQGPQGLKGDKGSPGTNGTNGTPGGSGREVVSLSSASDSNSTKLVTAECPAGKTVISGGHRIEGAAGQVVIDESEPAFQAVGEAKGWYVEAHEIGAGTTIGWSVTARAVCAVVG